MYVEFTPWRVPPGTSLTGRQTWNGKALIESADPNLDADRRVRRLGQGYGTEAAELMLWLAFDRIGLHRVGLSVFEFNERAIGSYEKVGFQVEGRDREAISRDGQRWDELTMGILAPEWQARHARRR